MQNYNSKFKNNENKNFYFAARVIYSPKRNAVLLQLRDDKAPINPNLWGLFGGGSKDGEKPIETFIREIKEEIGIKLDKNKIKRLRDYVNKDHNTKRNIFLVEKEIDESEIKLKEGAGFKWIGLNEVFNYDLSKSTRIDLEYFENNKN